MKKTFYILISLFLIGTAGYFTFVPTPHYLSPQEQEAVKKGKTFWDWQSPYGPQSIHYIEKGQGNRHVILVHGFRAHSYTWKNMVDPLVQAGYHVWCLDMIGYGLSDKPEKFFYHQDIFVQQIADFMVKKQIPQAHFIGNSMGGGLSLSTAVAHPEKVKSLILITALGYPLDLPFYLSMGQKLGHLLDPFLGRAMIKQGLEFLLYDKSQITDEQVDAYALPYSFPYGAGASVETLKNFNNQQLEKLSAHFPNIQHPVLIIWGKQDPLIPVSHYDHFVVDFPQADKLLIDKCGHMPQEETPHIVNEKVLKFLNQLDGKQLDWVSNF